MTAMMNAAANPKQSIADIVAASNTPRAPRYIVATITASKPTSKMEAIALQSFDDIRITSSPS